MQRDTSVSADTRAVKVANTQIKYLYISGYSVMLGRVPSAQRIHSFMYTSSLRRSLIWIPQDCHHFSFGFERDNPLGRLEQGVALFEGPP